MHRLKVKITKEILRHSMYAIVQHTDNRAMFFALKDIFPNSRTTHTAIYPFGLFKEHGLIKENNPIIYLPREATDFIYAFDYIDREAHFRLDLREFEFEVELSDDIIKRLDIPKIQKLLINHPTLKLIS